MNYTEITELALAYADRENDAELTSARLDLFIKMTESKINRKLDTMEMGTYEDTPMVDDQDFYALPSDYASMRDIKVIASGGGETTCGYLAPELIQSVPSDSDGVFYTIINNQIRIEPDKDSTNTLRVYYHQHVPALTSSNTTNWLSDLYPDVYVFGLMVEISSFVKDANAMQLWNDRFEQSLSEVEDEDVKRWSGPSPVTQLA